MRREVRFSVSLSEYAEIQAYVDAKKRWKGVSDLARDALYQLITRNPANRHGAVLHGAKEEG